MSQDHSTISPGVSHASAFSMTDSLYAAVKRRLVAFTVTSGSGVAATLRLPSLEESPAHVVSGVVSEGARHIERGLVICNPTSGEGQY